MRFRTPTSITAAALAALTIATTPAQAEPPPATGIHVYKLTAEGSGSLNRAASELQFGLGFEETTKATFSWKVETNVAFIAANGQAVVFGDQPGEAPGGINGTVTVNGTADGVVHGNSGETRVDTPGHCKSDITEPVEGASLVKGTAPYNPNDPGAQLVFRPFNVLQPTATCDGLYYAGANYINVWSGAPAEAFTQVLDLPAEATRQGKIIHLVEASPEQKATCLPVEWMKSCSLSWSGTVTLEYTGQLGGGVGGPGGLTEDDLPPLPSGPSPQPQPQPDDDLIVPLPNDDDLFVPIPSKPQLSGKTASLQVGCAGACSGTVTAYAAGGTRGAAAKPIGKAKFKAKAGKTAKVKLRLKRKVKSARLVIKVGKAKKTVVVKAKR